MNRLAALLADAHAVDGDRRVGDKRRGDDHGLDFLVLLQHLLVIAVRLDAVGLGAVDLLEAFAEGGLGVALENTATALAVGSGCQVERAQVADSDELEVLRVVLADEHAALVAAADQRGLHRFALNALVAEPDCGRDNRAGAGGDERVLEEVSPTDAVDRALVVRLPELPLFRGEIDGHGVIPRRSYGTG